LIRGKTVVSRKTTILLYPNPIVASIATLTLGGLKPGQFGIPVVKLSGQKVINQDWMWPVLRLLNSWTFPRWKLESLV